MTSPYPTFLRSITTIHTRNVELVQTDDFWREVLPNWTFLPVYDESGEYSVRMQGVRALTRMPSKRR